MSKQTLSGYLKLMFDMIKAPEVRALAESILRTVYKDRRYFFTAPASSSGKYHPRCCNVEGGLLRHTYRVVTLVAHLATAYKLSAEERDIVITAAMIHDTFKDDFENHAVLAGKLVAEAAEKAGLTLAIGEEMLRDIESAVAYHMGPWTRKDICKAMEDYTPIEYIVYIADYLASRPDISMDVDNMALPGEI